MLREYRRKRDFSKTAEPAPKKGKGSVGKRPLFVIQRHAARRLHDDFRLAMGGVLKSWAVPRGIPLEKGEKRLAVHVEDHPLEYARFEGVIPKGEYGGGTVMVWDIGEYEVGGGNPLRALEEGKLHLWLYGKKLRGEWALVRTRMRDGEQWLLMKTGESIHLGKSAVSSALTGRTMEAIAEEHDAEWHSNREPARKRVALPAYMPPMKSKMVEALPSGDWIYEVKFDGYRAIAVKGRGEAKLYSRNEKRLNFPEIAAAIARLPCKSGVFDGEVVALDDAGRPSFQLLQNRVEGALRYYLFDLLELDGEPLLALPLEERKARLAKLLADAGEPLRYSGDLPGKPQKVLEAVKTRGLEGVMAKKRGSRYEPGVRSGAWVKIKCVNEQEFVIGGYTQPKGARSHFGALLVGVYEGGVLKFAGKVGTGFDERLLRTLFERFQKMRVEVCPFDVIPKSALPPPDIKRCRWVRPELVCQIRFTEWTHDDRLRQPVFLGLREDMAAAEVVRERAWLEGCMKGSL